MWSLEVVA